MMMHADSHGTFIPPMDFLQRLQWWQDWVALTLHEENRVPDAHEFIEKSRWFIALLADDIMTKLERRKSPHMARVRNRKPIPRHLSLTHLFRGIYTQDSELGELLYENLNAYIQDSSRWIGELEQVRHAEIQLAFFLNDDA